MSAYLQSTGFGSLRAKSGEEALRLLRSIRPTAVVLDLILPGVEGIEVLRSVKSDPSSSTIPVVIVSIVDARREVMEFGADDYFVKPVDWTAFLARLSALTREAKSSAQPARAIGGET
jgi:DNA-binding response OmpR family regulator